MTTKPPETRKPNKTDKNRTLQRFAEVYRTLKFYDMKRTRNTRTGHAGQNIIEVDGVKYISSRHAQTVYNIARSTFSKKSIKAGISGRRLDSTNARYFTLPEAEQIANTPDYQSNRPKTPAQMFTTINADLQRIVDRLERVTNTANDYNISSVCARVLGTVEQAKKQVLEALKDWGQTEPPKEYKKRGRKAKSTQTGDQTGHETTGGAK